MRARLPSVLSALCAGVLVAGVARADNAPRLLEAPTVQLPDDEGRARVEAFIRGEE